MEVVPGPSTTSETISFGSLSLAFWDFEHLDTARQQIDSGKQYFKMSKEENARRKKPSVAKAKLAALVIEGWLPVQVDADTNVDITTACNPQYSQYPPYLQSQTDSSKLCELNSMKAYRLISEFDLS